MKLFLRRVCGSQKRTSTKTGRDAVFCLRCSFFLTFLPFFGTNFRNRTTFPSTRVRALFLHISLNHQTCVTFSVTFACNIRLYVCDIGIISVHLGVYVFVCVKLVDLTCVLYSV